MHGITACFRTGADLDPAGFGIQGKTGQKWLISLSFAASNAELGCRPVLFGRVPPPSNNREI
jgi:hypothetical protein